MHKADKNVVTQRRVSWSALVNFMEPPSISPETGEALDRSSRWPVFPSISPFPPRTRLLCDKPFQVRGRRSWDGGDVGIACPSAARIAHCRLWGLLLAGFIASCAPNAVHDARSNANAPIVAAAASPAPARNVPHPRAPAKATPVKLTMPAPPPPADGQINGLIGLDQAGLRSFLGEPTSREDGAPIQRWIYRIQHCHMDVTFFAEIETRTFRALNYEVDSDDDSPQQRRLCIQQFALRFPKGNDAR